MGIQAVIYQDESGAYCAEEALANIREAAELWLECVNEEVKDAPAGARLQRVAL